LPGVNGTGVEKIWVINNPDVLERTRGASRKRTGYKDRSQRSGGKDREPI
jgi:hypothetical protein